MHGNFQSVVDILSNALVFMDAIVRGPSGVWCCIQANPSELNLSWAQEGSHVVSKEMAMSKILFENDAVRCENIDGFGVYRLKSSAIELIVDVALKRSYHEFSGKLMTDETIKGIMYLYDLDNIDEQQYANKARAVADSTTQDDRKTFEMLFNANLDFAQRYLGCEKPTASGMAGAAGYDYLGFSMLHNYRCVSEEMVFINTLHTHGVPPAPLLSYFLKRSVGQSVATDILYLKERLHSAEAKGYGLVNEVASRDDVLERCLGALETMARIPRASFAVMQDFDRQDLHDLEEHIHNVKKANLHKILYS